MSTVGRVLFVTHNFPRFKGDIAGNFLLNLAKGLKNLGIDVEVVAPAYRSSVPSDVVDDIIVHRVSYSKNDWQNLAYDGQMLENVRSSWSGKIAFIGLIIQLGREANRIAKIAEIQGKPFAVIHSHWWFPAGLSVYLASFFNSKKYRHIITSHGSDVRLAEAVRIIHPIMRLVFKKASVITAVSSWLSKKISTIVPDIRVKTAPMPVDTSTFFSDQTERDDKFLFVGRLNEQKGIFDLLDALALTNNSVKCRIVGSGELTIVKEHASRLGIDSKVEFLGALSPDQLPQLYRRSIATIVPSKGEGLGLVAVESQLCGTPVIAYASGGIIDIVNPDHGGSLVQEGNVEELSQTISYLNKHRDIAVQKGELARQTMAMSFSPGAAAKNYSRLYGFADPFGD